MKKTAAVLGAGGFIGSHMVKRLKDEGYDVWGFDLKFPEYSHTLADSFVIQDLRLPVDLTPFDEVYALAADMGGAEYIFSGAHDADVMHNSALINLHVADNLKHSKTKVFYSSSACMYPQEIQTNTDNKGLKESDSYPASPDSEYGWEKLFSERLYLAYARNYGLNIRIARFHNIFGPEGTYSTIKAKAPGAICYKTVMATNSIDIIGDGNQTRSFLFIDECIEGVRRLMQSNYTQPLNIGSDEMVSINDLAKTIIEISGKSLGVNHINGPQGVRGRNSDNTLIQKVLGWKPTEPLRDGLVKTYEWINQQVTK